MTTITRGPRAADRFAIIANDALGDARLSFRARGLLAYLVSRPDGWRTNSETLATQASEGRDAIRTALRELEQAGYLTRAKVRDDAGRWVHTMMVEDSPSSAWKSGDGRPAAGEPSPDDQAVSSKTEGSKTETKSSAPTERATGGRGPADDVATSVYDRTGKAVKYPAVRGIAQWALTNRATTPEAVADTMVAIHTAGKPITQALVAQVLDGHLRLNGAGSALAQRDRQAFTEDWASGAAEASWQAMVGGPGGR